MHLLRSWHGWRILQDVQWPPTQRLKCTLRQDLLEHMICVGEVGREECRKRSEPFFHRLAHVANCNLTTLCHGCIRGVHEQVLESFLHCRAALCFGCADEICDRCVLHGRLLYVQLEGLEAFIGGFGEHSHVLFKLVAVLLPECFRAL